MSSTCTVFLLCHMEWICVPQCLSWECSCEFIVSVTHFPPLLCLSLSLSLTCLHSSITRLSGDQRAVGRLRDRERYEDGRWKSETERWIQEKVRDWFSCFLSVSGPECPHNWLLSVYRFEVYLSSICGWICVRINTQVISLFCCQFLSI